MVPEGMDDGEGPFVARVRDVVGTGVTHRCHAGSARQYYGRTGRGS
jgi:hypothetical protein